MKTKFTPGPWQAMPEECDCAYIRIRGTRLGCRYKVANVLTPIYDGVHEREAAETRANASLISVAPEMFEELRTQMERQYNPFEPDNQSDSYKRIAALLAKACGEPS